MLFFLNQAEAEDYGIDDGENNIQEDDVGAVNIPETSPLSHDQLVLLQGQFSITPAFVDNQESITYCKDICDYVKSLV